jgi:hypothetical protein
MPNETCPHEAAVLRAERSGQGEASLTAHVDSCPHCREAARIAGWMQTLAATAAKHRALPDPDLLWIKSRLFGQQAAIDRALQPLFLGDTLARAIVGAFAAAWLALSWPNMQSYLAGLWNASGAPERLVLSAANPWPITLISVAAALALLGVVRVVYPLLTRD